MNVRALAGLIMLLAAAGLLTVFFLNYDRNADLIPAPGPADTASAPLPSPGGPDFRAAVDSFLAAYNAAFADLWTAARRTAFAVCTSPDSTTAEQAAAARAAWLDFTGDAVVVAQLKDLRNRPDLTDLQDLQVEAAWRIAARHSGPAPRIPARSLAPAELERLYRRSRDPQERQVLWEARLKPGPHLRQDLLDLRDQRNAAAHLMGYSSYFGLQAADLDLTSGELLQLLDQTLEGVMPLYRELHGWARTVLAARYQAPVPRLIPPAWLGPGTGQGWADLAPTAWASGGAPVTTLPPLDSRIDPRQAAADAEDFFASLGFGRLPANFWEESRFGLAAAAGLPRTAAWQTDRGRDVRLLQVGPLDRQGLRLLTGEVGRCYTFLFCDRSEIPPVLREEPCRALGEGLAGLLSLAATVPAAPPPPVRGEAFSAPPRILALLEEALTGPVAWLPYAAGTAAHWEHDFYELELPRHLMNTRWWEYAARFQGLAPPTPRDERYCDPACEEGFLTDPGAAGHAALGAVITHQLHRYLCRQVLFQDIHTADYRGSLKAGDVLRSIMARGRTRDWARVLRETTGEEFSPTALVEYFEPLRAWLAEQNRGQEEGF